MFLILYIKGIRGILATEACIKADGEAAVVGVEGRGERDWAGRLIDNLSCIHGEERGSSWS